MVTLWADCIIFMYYTQANEATLSLCDKYKQTNYEISNNLFYYTNEVRLFHKMIKKLVRLTYKQILRHLLI